MKFTIKTEVFKKWLEIVNHATASVTTTPILENILLKVTYNSIILTANNLEMAIEYVISTDLEIKNEWALCIPSKLLIWYINLINDDNIDIESNSDDSVKITTGSWKIKIKWFNASEFPLIPKIKEETNLTINWGIIKKSIEKTLFSSAEWNIRPTLAWIFMNIKWNETIFATTDSFRLSEYKTILDKNIDKDFLWIIPSKTASQIKSIVSDSDEIKIVSWENQIAFLFWNTKLYSRLLNWKFPDYTWFFPLSFNTKSEINRIDLMNALKKINLISRENNYSIKMSFSKENWIFLETSETQIGESDITLVWTVDWEDNIIWINSIYFLEVLSVIDTTHISLSFESSLSPIMITPLSDWDDVKKDMFRHIIMPLKI